MNRTPILSGLLRSFLKEINDKNENEIIEEILYVDSYITNYNKFVNYLTPDLQDTLNKEIEQLVTDEVSMLSIRQNDDMMISFLPKGKDPIYNYDNTWSRQNRQVGKPAKIFQKLLVKQFKTRDWEIFANVIKAGLCNCLNFTLVSGEDIRYWYNCEHYYKCDGTLGNSCMRYEYASSYFDIYVDNAKMLITLKDGLLTGRAIVWQMGEITLLDRIYTCFDYLENCFIDYAKEQGWWIRENNSLLSTGDDQYWLTPDDNYTSSVRKVFKLTIPKVYDLFPYMDSFRYYDDYKELSTCDIYDSCVALDSTDGTITRPEVFTCACCGNTYTGYNGELPDDIYWSERDQEYYCGDCCWYCYELEDYIPNTDEKTLVYVSKLNEDYYPWSYVEDNLITDPNDETEESIVEIDGKYYSTNYPYIEYNEEEQCYVLQSNPN